jgi:hypothetical protein
MPDIIAIFPIKYPDWGSIPCHFRVQKYETALTNTFAAKHCDKMEKFKSIFSFKKYIKQKKLSKQGNDSSGK